MGVSTAAAGQAGRRRDPVQERSQETVGRVVAAAGRLLARGVPPPALTTAQIAREAGLSVGALYRFFPDKQAVIDAIAKEHLAAFQAALANALMADLPESPAGFLAMAIDAFAAYLAAHADFRTLAYGAPPGAGRAISTALFEAQLGGHPDGAGEMAAMVRNFLSTMFAVAPDAAFDFRLRIAAEIGDRLIAHAFAQADPRHRARVLEEAKRLISSYLFSPLGADGEDQSSNRNIA
ncbi:MAG: TetR/AcrR family transcriptional regulator [Acetobacteraceae bacterium]|nr:TetR/AcrR family transcriptional regulator [Acetobacteraceae bacterium]